MTTMMIPAGAQSGTEVKTIDDHPGPAVPTGGTTGDKDAMGTEAERENTDPVQGPGLDPENEELQTPDHDRDHHQNEGEIVGTQEAMTEHPTGAEIVVPTTETSSANSQEEWLP
jgi:hypothetical protein